MRKFVILMLCLSFLVVWVDWAQAKEYQYKIKKDITVLAFLGKPESRKLKTIRYTTFIEQDLTYLHNRGGPGIYAFYIEGLITKDENGNAKVITEQGYFLARRRQLIITSK